MPSTIPSQEFSRMPIQGNIKNATPVYNGCFTIAKGPAVMSSCCGTLANMSFADHTQLITPVNKKKPETHCNKSEGPPTLKKPG